MPPPPPPSVRDLSPAERSEVSNTNWLQMVTEDENEAFLKLGSLPSSKEFIEHNALIEPFNEAANRIARVYMGYPTSRNMILVLGLPALTLLWGVKKRPIGMLKNRLLHYPEVPFPVIENTVHASPTEERSLADRIHTHVAREELKQAAHKVRGEAALAPDTAETRRKLMEKFPDGTVCPFATGPGPNNAIISKEDLCAAANSLNNTSGVGLSGWSARLLKHLMLDINSDFVTAMAILANQISNGTAEGALFLTTSILVPLRKPNNGVRPICIGEMIYRMITKAVLISIDNVIPQALHTHQWGVNNPGGVEPMIALITDKFLQFQNRPSGTIPVGEDLYLSLYDQRNAFNSVHRTLLNSAVNRYCPSIWRLVRWIYNQPSQMVIYNNNNSGSAPTILHAKNGVKQGCPLSPLLYSICIRDIFTALETFVKNLDPNAIIMAYLDDIAILSKDPQTLAKVTSFLNTEEIIDRIGLRLNVEKCSNSSFSSLSLGGVKLLGSFIGGYEGRKHFLQDKINKTKEHISTLHTLPYQDALLIFRYCINPELLHLSRSMESTDLEDLWFSLDSHGRKFINHISGLGLTPLLNDLESKVRNHILSLPVRLGGLGITNYVNTRVPARTGFLNATSHFLCNIYLPNSIPCTDDRLNGEFKTQQSEMSLIHLSSRTALIQLLENQQLRSSFFDMANDIHRAWLRILPTKIKHTFSNREVSIAVSRIQLLHPTGSSTCRYCHRRMDINHEEVCDQTNKVRDYRHNEIRNLKLNTLTMKLKAHGMLTSTQVLLEPRAYGEGVNTMRVDLRIAGPNSVNNRGLDFDTKVTALTPLAIQKIFRDKPDILAEVTGATVEPSTALSDYLVLLREQEKIRKYGRTVYPFRPLIVSTGGTMNTFFKDFVKDELEEFGPRFKCDLSAILMKYHAKLFPRRLRNYN